MRIWLVEDDPQSRIRGQQAIADALKAGGVGGEILVTKKVAWPPGFGGHDGDSIISPDIVVLDLWDESRRFTGGQFYEALRDMERKRHLRRGALIIAWSMHSADQETELFVETTLERDHRFMAITKDAYSLKETIQSCLRRVKEESDVRR